MAARMFRFCRTVFFMLLLGTSLSINADDSEDTTMVIGCPYTSIYNFGTLSKVTGNYEVVDYISSAFRLPSPKPYAANKKDVKFVYGADFAVEGSTALDTYFTTNNYVSKQVDQFVTHLSSICSNRQECWKKLRHAVFLVEEFRSRDYFHALSEGIKALMELSSQHPQVQIVFADYYKTFIALLKSLRKTCGGSKGGDATAVCSDPKKYIHSNENHLTQEANKFMAEAIVTAGSESFVYPKLNLPYRSHCVM
ncbi:acetylajmalan esterase-like [Papaver somniferum]|uniref:acetylajmalan esterase-like n=1 Tax=Papaver somniferum TaxID=3469 RepID=UPI000E703A3A|nr:acetylajmalan esterase-like [Papaver somniferum]